MIEDMATRIVARALGAIGLGVETGTLDDLEPDWVEAQILENLPMRFAVWSPAASPFIEEIADAAMFAGIEPATLHGHSYCDAPYMTDDPDAVERFKSKLGGWIVAVFDKSTGETVEEILPE